MRFNPERGLIMKTRLTVRLPSALSRELSGLAARLHLKRSDVVRMALEKFLTEFRIETESCPYGNVQSLLGSVCSGIPDLGENHREYLRTRHSPGG